MLIPAILKKQEIENAFKKYYYSDEMMFETGSLDNWLPEISENPDGSRYQYAIVDNNKKLIGYLTYAVDWYSSKAYNFGLFSFDRGNPLVGKEVFEKLEELVSTLHRVEWRAVGGNTACRGYDSFIKRHNGRKHILKDCIKDRNGNYHDDIIYEIINGE